MERKELSGIEEYPGGLSSIPDNFLQPMRLCGFKANISRIQVQMEKIGVFPSFPQKTPTGAGVRERESLRAQPDGIGTEFPNSSL
jgi:2'-5' RNA ligase